MFSNLHWTLKTKLFKFPEVSDSVEEHQFLVKELNQPSTRRLGEHTSEVFDEIVKFHPPVRLKVRGMQISVEHDDCKGKDKDSIHVA